MLINILIIFNLRRKHVNCQIPGKIWTDIQIKLSESKHTDKWFLMTMTNKKKHKLGHICLIKFSSTEKKIFFYVDTLTDYLDFLNGTYNDIKQTISSDVNWGVYYYAITGKGKLNLTFTVTDQDLFI